MEHASNNDVDKLRAIVFEMDKIIRALSPRKTMPFDKSIRDVDTLQEIIRERGKIIYDLTPSSYLKGVVNSVFDTTSVDESLEDLKIYNKKLTIK